MNAPASDPRFEVMPPAGPPQQRPAKPKAGGIAGWIAGLLVAVAKFKFLLFGSLKTILSMGLMIWLYSTMFGWPFAAGFVFLIFVHEMGHIVAAKWLGIPVSAPLFIPFVGAAITMKQNPRDAWTEALMAYGGPLAGGIGSWICFGLALDLHLQWMMAVASASFVINLWNMIPVPPLDGGRICAAVSPWFWILGVILLGASLFLFHQGASIIIIVVILVFALPRLKATLFQPHTEEMKKYYAMTMSRRMTMALLYLALIGVLLFGYANASIYLRYVWDQASAT
jgi:Zn-dependent protease